MQYKKLNMNKIYEEYCETINEVASEEVQESYSAHNKAFDEYIAAVSENSFLNGFRHALRLLGKEVSA